MTWNVVAKPEILKFEDFWKKPHEIVQKTGLKVLLWGEPETGKTHAALTFPPPVYVVDTEFGTAPLLHKFEGKEIYVFEACQLDARAEVDPLQSLEAVEKAITALQRLEKGTVVIDSATDIWQWIVMWLEQTARRKTESGQPYRFEYGEANRRYRKLIMRLMAQPVNVVLTAQVQSVFDIDGRETGARVPRVQRQTQHMVDLSIHLQKSFNPATKGVVYVGTIEKCRWERTFHKEIVDVTYERIVAALKELGVEVRQ